MGASPRNLRSRLPAVAVLGVALALPLSVVGTHEARAELHQGPPAAPAQINADILVLRADNNNTGIDPKLGKMPELSQPPLSMFNSFKVESRGTVNLGINHVASTTMPERRSLDITYTGLAPLPPNAPKQPPKFVLNTVLQKPGGGTPLLSATVNASSGKWFFIMGPKYAGGATLVIGIKVL